MSNKRSENAKTVRGRLYLFPLCHTYGFVYRLKGIRPVNLAFVHSFAYQSIWLYSGLLRTGLRSSASCVPNCTGICEFHQSICLPSLRNLSLLFMVGICFVKLHLAMLTMRWCRVLRHTLLARGDVFIWITIITASISYRSHRESRWRMYPLLRIHSVYRYTREEIAITRKPYKR